MCVGVSILSMVQRFSACVL